MTIETLLQHFLGQILEGLYDEVSDKDVERAWARFLQERTAELPPLNLKEQCPPRENGALEQWLRHDERIKEWWHHLHVDSLFEAIHGEAIESGRVESIYEPQADGTIKTFYRGKNAPHSSGGAGGN
jgi:hypothetical protein